MRTAALLLLGLLGTAMAARQLTMDEPMLLDEYSPLYNVLNITGWEDYPEGCWLFPQPAINLVVDGSVHLVSASAADASKVALDWCMAHGFDAVGEMRVADFSESQVVQTVDLYTGAVCTGVGQPGGVATNGCSALKYVECLKDGATSGCSRRFTTNNGNNNMGYGNGGSAAIPGETGSDNLGNFNQGSTNLGDFNVGSTNVGSYNMGSANYGNCIVGSALKNPNFECGLDLEGLTVVSA